MKRTSRQELAELLNALGIRRNDTVSVAAFLPSLGLVEGGIAGLVATLRDALGPDGTLVVPTFTASFRRREIFDVSSSPSFNGALSEHVRRLPGAIRSTCGLFAQAAIGPRAEYLMRRPTDACFGEGSVFSNIFAADAKLIGLGIDWDEGYSWFMHLERLASVPFRRDEVFEGFVRQEDGTVVAARAVHFVRAEEIIWKRHRGPMGQELVAKGVAREVLVGGCAHRLLRARAVEDFVVPRLQRDPWCMAERGGVC